MGKLDWSCFNKRISIKSDPLTIFNSWASQENIEKWFLSKAEFRTETNSPRDRLSKIEKGNRYVWMWHGSDNVAEGEILEITTKTFFNLLS